MNLCQRTSERLNKVIIGFLDRYGLLDADPVWEIRESPLGGFGVFVRRDVNVGEVIFRDFPVILGPRCVQNSPLFCVGCYGKNNLQICDRGCGLPICSQTCQKKLNHLEECKILRQHYQSNNNFFKENDTKTLFENLTPIRALLLSTEDKEVVYSLIAHLRDQHGHEIDTLRKKLGFEFKEDEENFLKFVCCVLDANAFEVTVGDKEDPSSLRGLYPLGSLANHSCVPNVVHVFNKNQEMIAKAAVFIPKDSEIVHSYTRVIWGTTTRLYHLHTTKHFVCKCTRCKDPTEFGTFMGSVLCKACRGLVSPVNPFKSFGKWQCKDCNKIIMGKDASDLLIMLSAILKDSKSRGYDFMYKFLNGKLMSVVPETNQIAAEIKYSIVWILGHKEGYRWSELSLDLLKVKEKICYDLLELLEKLLCGQSKMRGLLLYELFCTKREIINRKQLLVTQDIQKLLIEAATILKFDATAPPEIQKINNES